jgi:hypothetical protein
MAHHREPDYDVDLLTLQGIEKGGKENYEYA